MLKRNTLKFFFMYELIEAQNVFLWFINPYTPNISTCENKKSYIRLVYVDKIGKI